MLAFEGNTAPYLQYAHARVRSIFGRADSTVRRGRIVLVAEPAERALALALLGFGAGGVGRRATLEPHRLAAYLFTLATAFSRFFEACPVLSRRRRCGRAGWCCAT